MGKISDTADPSVVILIIAHKERISPYEVISMRQCFKVLGHYPIKFISPEGMNVDQYLEIIPGASFDFIPPYWQSSYMNYRALRTLPFLFKRYQQYDYILFHELDAFVFRDELMEWCRKGYSFIGAPFLKDWNFSRPDASFVGVGNGGFNLRKVVDHLRAINSFSYIERPGKIWQRFKDAPLARKPYLFFDIVEKLTIRNNTHPWFNDWMGKRSEDVFWGTIMNRNFEYFTVPDPLEALRFSFEVQPQNLYEFNNKKLPFGCHAWWRYDLNFWRPFICDYGYQIL